MLKASRSECLKSGTKAMGSRRSRRGLTLVPSFVFSFLPRFSAIPSDLDAQSVQLEETNAATMLQCEFFFSVSGSLRLQLTPSLILSSSSFDRLQETTRSRSRKTESRSLRQRTTFDPTLSLSLWLLPTTSQSSNLLVHLSVEYSHRVDFPFRSHRILPTSSSLSICFVVVVVLYRKGTVLASLKPGRPVELKTIPISTPFQRLLFLFSIHVASTSSTRTQLPTSKSAHLPSPQSSPSHCSLSSLRTTVHDVATSSRSTAGSSPYLPLPVQPSSFTTHLLHFVIKIRTFIPSPRRSRIRKQSNSRSIKQLVATDASFSSSQERIRFLAQDLGSRRHGTFKSSSLSPPAAPVLLQSRSQRSSSIALPFDLDVARSLSCLELDETIGLVLDRYFNPGYGRGHADGRPPVEEGGQGDERGVGFVEREREGKAARG